MKMTKVLATTAVAALLISTSAVAFAASGTPGNPPKERPAITTEQRAETQVQMKEKLAQSLADGKITQEQYDAMISGDMSGFGGRGHGFKGEMSEMTDEQKAEMQAQMKEKLVQALADGKITQEQYDAMISGEMPEMTDEQKAEMQAQMKEKLAQELADGKITQEQYDAMISGDMSGFGGRGQGFKGDKPELTDEQKANFNFPAQKGFKAP